MDTHQMIESALGRLINQTGLVLSRNFQKELEPFDITLEQWGILNTLWQKDGITFKELAEKANKDHTNTSRIIDKLEKKALIRRSPHPEDRRACLLFVTDKGNELREEVFPVAKRVAERERAGISSEEEAILRTLLVKICRNVQD